MENFTKFVKARKESEEDEKEVPANIEAAQSVLNISGEWTITDGHGRAYRCVWHQVHGSDSFTGNQFFQSNEDTWFVSGKVGKDFIEWTVSTVAWRGVLTNDGRSIENGRFWRKDDGMELGTFTGVAGTEAKRKFEEEKARVLTRIKEGSVEAYHISGAMKRHKDVILALIQKGGPRAINIKHELIGGPMMGKKEVVLALIGKGVVVDPSEVHDAIRYDEDIKAPMEEAKKKFEEEKAEVLTKIDVGDQQNAINVRREIMNGPMMGDKDVVLAFIRKGDDWAFQFASANIHNDKEVALAAVKLIGLALMDASDELKNTKEVVIAAVQQNWRAHKFASEDLQKDPDIKKFVIDAVSKNGEFMFASDALTNDPEFVLKVVETDGYAFMFASHALNKDREFVLKVVETNGDAFRFASDALKKDSEFILKVVEKDGKAFEFAHDTLKNDKDFVLKVVEKDGTAITYASEELKNDADIVRTAFQQINTKPFDKSEDVKSLVLETVRKRGLALKFASDKLKNAKDVVLAAVHQDVDACGWMDRAMWAEKEVVLAIVQKNLVQKNCKFPMFSSDHLRKDPDIKKFVIDFSPD